MTYLSRELIRRMIIAEARKKARLLPGGGVNFDDEATEPLTSDLTALDMSRVELTQPLDIATDTKIEDVPAPAPTDLRSLYDFDDDDLPDPYDDEVTDPNVDVSGLRGFDDGESETDEDDNPDYNQFVQYSKYIDPRLGGMTSRHDPDGETHDQIKKRVFDAHRELYKPPTKKSKAQEEAEFLKQMEDMIASGKAATQFPDDPEFAPLDDSTLELPKDRFSKSDEDTKDMRETIRRLVAESVRNKIKKNSKSKRY